MKIASKLILGFLALALVIFSMGIFSYIQLLNIEKTLQNDLLESIDELSDSLRINGAMQLIRYYDEVLTQSVRNYVLSNTPTWKTRYFKFEPELDRVIKTTKSSLDAFDKYMIDMFNEIDSANEKLVAMETRAISLMEEGKFEEAAAILESSEYLGQKLVLANNVEEYFSMSGGSYESALEDSTISLRITEKLIEGNVNRSTNFSILLSLIALFLSVILGLFISGKITTPVRELVRVSSEIETRNFNVRANVKTGDELEELSRTLNKSVEALSILDAKHREMDKTKSEFLSITSHELRSPMTPMKAQLQMLLKGYFGNLNVKQRNSMKIVLNNTVRLDNIIVDLLEISRMEAGRLKFNFTSTNLKKEISMLLEEMKGFMPEKKIVIEPRIRELPAIECDPDRIMQVLRNFVNNAIKFSPENSKIIVGAKPLKNEILFSVQDFGIGIPRKILQKVFDPFYQGEETMYRKYGGTGLGLTICKGIVEMQNGRIWVNSKKGKGSTFFFTIPFKPTKEAKPLNLLIRRDEDISKEVKGIIRKYLGPMADREFALISEKGMRLDFIIKHMEELRSNDIISEETHEKIMGELYKIFKFLPKRGNRN